ncbi:hypothetical protein DU508_04595 [Pedobacter chinensis]|uniref:Uncharacterized protein n=1 Tax=Pedobacter chinensis TaxID=2282421 RepID=A0A369Q424_9SPHI|nr:hypothetical protein DU508_04595 [Pedobacter chinensis]
MFPALQGEGQHKPANQKLWQGEVFLPPKTHKNKQPNSMNLEYSPKPLFPSLQGEGQHKPA